MYYRYSLGSSYIHLLLKGSKCLITGRLTFYYIYYFTCGTSAKNFPRNVLCGDRIPSTGERTILVFTALSFLQSSVDGRAKVFDCTENSLPFTN